MTSPHEQALAAAEVELSHVLSDFHYVMPDDGMARVIVAYLASLPADVDGLMLKSLEWKQTDDAIGEEAFVASTPVGEYLATEAGLYFHVSDATSGDLLLATNGTSEAKTAAFADYSRRILPAIDTSALSAKLAAVARERDTLTERLAEMEAGLARIRDYPEPGESKGTDDGYPLEVVYDKFAYRRIIDSYRAAASQALGRARKETPDAQ